MSDQIATVCRTAYFQHWAVPDLLWGNPAEAGFCWICKANMAGAGAGAGFHHTIDD